MGAQDAFPDAPKIQFSGLRWSGRPSRQERTLRKKRAHTRTRRVDGHKPRGEGAENRRDLSWAHELRFVSQNVMVRGR